MFCQIPAGFLSTVFRQKRHSMAYWSWYSEPPWKSNVAASESTGPWGIEVSIVKPIGNWIKLHQWDANRQRPCEIFNEPIVLLRTFKEQSRPDFAMELPSSVYNLRRPPQVFYIIMFFSSWKPLLFGAVSAVSAASCYWFMYHRKRQSKTMQMVDLAVKTIMKKLEIDAQRVEEPPMEAHPVEKESVGGYSYFHMYHTSIEI